MGGTVEKWIDDPGAAWDKTASSAMDTLGFTDAAKEYTGANTLAGVLKEDWGSSSTGLAPLNLDWYEGETDVGLSPYDKNIMDLTNQLVTGEYGTYKDMLSGDPELGYAQSLINLKDTDFRENLMPQIQENFSGSPLGSSWNTGARRQGEAEALYNNFEQSQLIRADAFKNAQQVALQAQGMLPAMASIQAQERTNNILNKERELKVWYQNQGLDATEYQADLQEAQLALQQSMFDLSVEQWEQAQAEAERASKAGLWGSIGSFIGGGIGFMTRGPAGAAVGSQLGGGAGLTMGGAPEAGYATLGQVPSSLMSMQLMNSMYPPQNPSPGVSPSMTVLSQPGGSPPYPNYSPALPLGITGASAPTGYNTADYFNNQGQQIWNRTPTGVDPTMFNSLYNLGY